MSSAGSLPNLSHFCKHKTLRELIEILYIENAYYLVISQFKIAQNNSDGVKLLWTKVWGSNPFRCTIFQRAPSEFCVYKNGSNLAQSLLSTVYTTYLHLLIFSKKGLMLLVESFRNFEICQKTRSCVVTYAF